MNAITFLTISSIALLAMATDDTQQQLEASLIKVTPEVNEFLRQLTHSARRERSLSLYADEVFNGLDERNLVMERHREAMRRHRAALKRRKEEEEEEALMRAIAENELAEGLEDEEEDPDQRDDDNGLVENEENEDDELEDRMDEHNKAHEKLKSIHKALKNEKAQPQGQLAKAPNKANKQVLQAMKLNPAVKKQIPKGKMEDGAKMHKRQNMCNIWGSQNNQWCHNTRPYWG